MILRTKRLIILFTVSLYLRNYCNCDFSDENLNSESDEEDEDDKLKQALILVDLLKGEYLRVVRENSELRNGVEETTPTEEQSTCAPTIAGDGDTTLDATYTVTESAPPPGQSAPERMPQWLPQFRPLVPVTLSQSLSPFRPSVPDTLAQSLPPTTRTPLSDLPLFLTRHPLAGSLPQNQQHPLGYFRRRIPAEYYYYGPQAAACSLSARTSNLFGIPKVITRMYGELPDNFRRSYADNTGPNNIRRFDYPGPVPSDPVERFSIKINATKLAKTSNASVAITASVAVISTTEAKTNVSTPAPPSTNLTTTKSVSPYATRGKVKKLVSRSSSISTKRKGKKDVTKDPVMAQVASELIRELKEDVPSLRERSYSNSKSDYNTKHGKPSQNEVVFVKPRTTLRIHMAHSTRYPLPLPENHAFCYYSPRNPLCSTFV